MTRYAVIRREAPEQTRETVEILPNEILEELAEEILEFGKTPHSKFSQLEDEEKKGELYLIELK